MKIEALCYQGLCVINQRLKLETKKTIDKLSGNFPLKIQLTSFITLHPYHYLSPSSMSISSAMVSIFSFLPSSS